MNYLIQGIYRRILQVLNRYRQTSLYLFFYERRNSRPKYLESFVYIIIIYCFRLININMLFYNLYRVYNIKSIGGEY